MGQAIAELGWPRHSYVISTKFFWGLHSGPTSRNTLNRKYLLEAIDPSLERLGLDHVDLVFCHRHDSETPLEETVWACSDIVSSGKAHYWGTSEWRAEQLLDACRIADARCAYRPISNQPQYSILRRGIERAVLPTSRREGIGQVVWSPLAQGALTGKYAGGQLPPGSRAADAQRNRFMSDFLALGSRRGLVSLLAEGERLTATEAYRGAPRLEHPAPVVSYTNVGEETGRMMEVMRRILPRSDTARRGDPDLSRLPLSVSRWTIDERGVVVEARGAMRSRRIRIAGCAMRCQSWLR